MAEGSILKRIVRDANPKINPWNDHDDNNDNFDANEEKSYLRPVRSIEKETELLLGAPPPLKNNNNLYKNSKDVEKLFDKFIIQKGTGQSNCECNSWFSYIFGCYCFDLFNNEVVYFFYHTTKVFCKDDLSVYNENGNFINEIFCFFRRIIGRQITHDNRDHYYYFDDNEKKHFDIMGHNGSLELK